MLAKIGMVGVLTGRFLSAGTLLIAGIAKVRSGQNSFLSAILGFDLVPEGFAKLLSRWLPWLEILTGSFLLVGFMSQEAALVAFGLYLVFSLVIAISLVRGRDNDCGCFGKLTPVQWRLVYRNVFLMGLLLPVYAYHGGALAIDGLADTGANQPIPLLSNDLRPLMLIWGIALMVVVLIQGLIRLNIVLIDDHSS